MEEEIEDTDGYQVRFLAKGGFGRVYLGTKNNERITIKILKDQSFDQINSLRREAQILSRLKHQNIINLIEFREQLICTYDDGSVKEKVGMKIEYAELGTLANFAKTFSEGLCRYFFIQLLYGLKYLVDNRICHRDIKPLNLVLNSQYILKIIDFGLACENQDLKKNCGTKSYKAPEVGVQGRIYDGEKVDVFAAGVTLLELYTGVLPFYQSKDDINIHNNNHENFILFLKNQQGEFWTKMRQKINKKIQFSDAFISLIEGMLHPNPHQRFTVQQCLDHEWMQVPIPLQQTVILELGQNYYIQPLQQQLEHYENIINMRSDFERVSDDNLDLMKYKFYKLNFENLKIKTDSLVNMLNQHISILDPQILILELLYWLMKLQNDKNYDKSFKLEFDKLSKKTYSVIFNIKALDSKQIGKIQIDLYKLENNLIRVNIIKLEGDFEDYLKAKQGLVEILQKMG